MAYKAEVPKNVKRDKYADKDIVFTKKKLEKTLMPEKGMSKSKGARKRA